MIIKPTTNHQRLYERAGSRLRALSLWQPWASLVSHGWKFQETRSWAAPESIIGTRIAIHAAQRRPGKRQFTYEEETLIIETLGWGWRGYVAFGALIATIRVDECWEIDRLRKRPAKPGRGASIHARANFHFGDFGIGRYVWEISDFRLIEPPFPCRGRQGLFHVDYKEKIDDI